MSFINGKIEEFGISTLLLVYACTKFDETDRHCLFPPNKDKGLNLDGVNYKVLGYCPVLNGKICGFCTLNFTLPLPNVMKRMYTMLITNQKQIKFEFG